MGLLWGLLEPLGTLSGALGASGDDILVILGALDRILEPLGTLLGPLGRSRGCLGSLLGGSWEHFGDIGELFWTYFGAWEASLKRFAETLKNREKTWKVLQKSSFEGSQIRWKIVLEGKLGQLLTLSWLVRVQIGAKRGKLTLQYLEG